jgi:hypothetical protein
VCFVLLQSISVENLQLGRLNDCMQHYQILQSNLVSLAGELDNFPADELDPYSLLNIFPDEIMRKDVLEDLRPVGTKSVPTRPIIPPCSSCLANKVSLQICFPVAVTSVKCLFFLPLCSFLPQNVELSFSTLTLMASFHPLSAKRCII